MSTKRNLVDGFQECVSRLWSEGDLTDLGVKVRGKTFRCHRFILAACSGFFRGLLRSGMKEQLRNEVPIEGISEDIFEIVLNSIYTGVCGLTVDNMIDIWHAVNQLQIEYMIHECEEFAMLNISPVNFYIVLQTAKLLDSDRALKHTHQFMISNFERIRSEEGFLNLTIEELHQLIDSDELNISSEHLVIESIFKWVDHSPQSVAETGPDCENSGRTNNPGNVTAQAGGEAEDDMSDLALSDYGANIPTQAAIAHQMESDIPGTENTENTASNKQEMLEASQLASKLPRNDRMQHLKRLLAAARLYLVSRHGLQMLLERDRNMAPEYRDSLDMLPDLVLYLMTPERQTAPWSRAATHRLSSPKDNVMVYVSGGKLKAYSLNSGTEHKLADLSQEGLEICVSNNVLVMLSLTSTAQQQDRPGQEVTSITQHYSIFTHDKTWRVVSKIQQQPSVILLSNAHHIYRYQEHIVYGDENEDEDTSYELSKAVLIKEGHSHSWIHCASFDDSIMSMISFGQYIILFPESSGPIQCFDTTTGEKFGLNPIDGDTENIVSFSDHQDTYILQRNGSLRKIISTEPTEENFHFVAKLWDFDLVLRGALLHGDQLFVFGNGSNDTPSVRSLSGVFSCLKIVSVDSATQCLPMIVPKKWYKKYTFSLDSVHNAPPPDADRNWNAG